MIRMILILTAQKIANACNPPTPPVQMKNKKKKTFYFIWFGFEREINDVNIDTKIFVPFAKLAWSGFNW